MTFRGRATFSFFAVAQLDAYGKATDLWRGFGALDDHRYKSAGVWGSLDLFPLERGPANRARFLARYGGGGCAGGSGVGYYVHEWDPQDSGDLSEILKLEGAASRNLSTDQGGLSQKDREDWFGPIGKLQTQGSLITLPYCWFSGLDTWDNPNLCALNFYDLSGDRVRFVSSVYNRPDLLPVAKAIEYAQARDYAAVLAYCGSPDIARRMVADIPISVFSPLGLDVSRIGALKKRVEVGRGIDGQYSLQFDVEQRGDRWLVVSFQMN
jgi:hypothetical protein